MNLPRLYVITDRDSAARGCGDVVSAVEQAAMAGARMFQFREKELPSGELLALARRMTTALAGYGADLYVNDRADVAMALDAAGVHRPQSGLPLDIIRRVLETRPIGVSCHSIEEARRAQKGGAAFITLSPIFPTASKPGYGPTLGFEALREISETVKIPVYALGGIEPSNAADCIRHGASGVAVMSGIMAAADPHRATTKFLAALGPN